MLGTVKITNHERLTMRMHLLELLITIVCSLGMTVQPMDVNDPSYNYYMTGTYGFCHACRDKKFEVVKLLVKRDGVNTRNMRRETRLHSAIKENYFEAAQYLIEQGADLNARDGQELTPLLCMFDNFYYAYSQDMFYPKDIALLLLNHGANPFEKHTFTFVNGSISAYDNAKIYEKTDLVVLFETYFLRKTTAQDSRGKKLANIAFRFE